MSAMGGLFKWLDILEAEFDRAHVEIDLILKELEPDDYQLASNVRGKMTTMCAAFSQLSQKTQAIFQNNCKLEAQLYSAREDLTDVRAQNALIDGQHRQLLFQLHQAQLQRVQSASVPHNLRSETDHAQSILHSLGNGSSAISKSALEDERLRAEAIQLRKENEQLRMWLVESDSELFAAQLATKYLDKELAGRIQQIQLLARDFRGQEHDHLWNQLEAEINLHRHKTITQACRRRTRLKRRRSGAEAKVSSNEAAKGQRLEEREMTTGNRKGRVSYRVTGNDVEEGSRRESVNGVVRQVEIFKPLGQNLGLTITGGQEHGVPIVVSDTTQGHLANQSGAFIIGDAILSVNGLNLRGARHDEAVQILSQLSGKITFELLYIQADSEDESDVDVDFPRSTEFRQTALPVPAADVRTSQHVERARSYSTTALTSRSPSPSQHYSPSLPSSLSGSRCSAYRRARFPGHAVPVATASATKH